ncbi:BREX-2 system phosphatase PglZ [Melissospora conviva]|uniref:BREX-2 system phosphatase PglZ n=1 Tax=Melissospora conviva TaxID=3388432 RepID=UPI003C18DADE
MTQAPAAPHALRISPVALEQKVVQQLTRHRNGTAYPIMVVRAEPVWPHEPAMLLPDGRPVRVEACVSPLAIWEQVVTHQEDEVLVLLTDLPENRLGAGVRSRIFKQRVITVEPWDLVVEAFGAQRPDSALEAERWAGEALLDAMPPAGWPKLATSVLTRDVALRHLAAVRLGLHREGDTPDDLDVVALLRWSFTPGAVKALRLLRTEEQQGLARWIAGQYGRPAKALIALVDAGHGADALPLGLVCEAIWSNEDPDARRAQGRIDQYFGHLDDDLAIRALAEVTVQIVATMLTDRERTVRQQAHAVLDRAEELLLQFHAAASATHSDILRTGFQHRLDAAAAALLTGLDAAPGRDLDDAVAQLSAHRLAVAEPERVRRVQMAQRLVRWLGTDIQPPLSVADGIDRQIADWGWVDAALGHVWAGDDARPQMQAAFRAVHDRAQQRRRELDEAFASRLAAWTQAGTSDNGDLLTVERLRSRVIDPLVRSRQPVLFVLLDGMSAAVAVELAAALSEHWVEYDPIAAGGTPRRRGVVAALPTLTAVCRTSLFAGTLRSGNQDTEKQAFAKGEWGKNARVFHKGPSLGGAGQVLATELADAVAGPDQLVAVVLNTVDDSLAHGREGNEAGWELDDLGFLRTLLDHARSAGRAVVLTSDHGHVLERGGEYVRVADAASARHRTGAGPAGPGEVELAGPRVVAPDNRIIALWDPERRYRPSKAGYHGGASLAEVTIPLLAFLMPAVTAIPTGWAAVETQEPGWWNAADAPSTASAPQGQAAPARKPRRRTPEPAGAALFDVPTVEPDTAPVDEDFVSALTAGDLFDAQLAMLPRRTDRKKIEAAVRALVEAKGILPLAVLAERAGEVPVRAGGFANVLQRIFNVDNYPVVSLIDDGRTVRLDIPLLREQFGLPKAAS